MGFFQKTIALNCEMNKDVQSDRGGGNLVNDEHLLLAFNDTELSVKINR